MIYRQTNGPLLEYILKKRALIKLNMPAKYEKNMSKKVNFFDTLCMDFYS